jgi:hypothetical protein
MRQPAPGRESDRLDQGRHEGRQVRLGALASNEHEAARD